MNARKSPAAVTVLARRKGRPANRGALFVIAMLLGVSGLIRFGEGAGRALANAAHAPETTPAPEPVLCETGTGAMELLSALRVREELLAGREAQLADRAQALTLAKAEIDTRLADLVAAEEKLAGTLALADEAADKDVARLVAVYEKMKPKDAAPLFEQMDPQFAAGFLARMRPEAAAAVMAGLDPKTAYTISVLLAGRNANAPRN